MDLAQLLAALKDSQFRSDVGQGVTDAANRGVIGGLLGAPVDLLTMAMRPLGYKVEKPFMGSEFIGEELERMGVVSGKRNMVAEGLASVALPMGAARMAPKVFAAEQAAVKNAMVPRTMNSQTGAINVSALAERFPTVDFRLNQHGANATLAKVVVPKADRGTGLGSDFMSALTKAADDDGATLALSPSGDFGGSKARLVDFYKRFGFVPNKGRNIDYEISESMLRIPK